MKVEFGIRDYNLDIRVFGLQWYWFKQNEKFLGSLVLIDSFKEEYFIELQPLPFIKVLEFH